MASSLSCFTAPKKSTGSAFTLAHNYIQETQLSLTNRATRLEVRQGYQTSYHSMLGMISY